MQSELQHETPYMLRRGSAIFGDVCSIHTMRDIQCSDQLRAKLESCQDRVIQVLGGQGGGLQCILKHAS